MADRPTAHATVLLAAVPELVRLEEADPATLPRDLAETKELFDQAVLAQGGRPFPVAGLLGGGLFPTAAAALTAALAVQGPLPTGLALHTGIVYGPPAPPHGPAVTQAASLIAAAHGGQILLSASAAAAVRAALPGEVQLRDLGEGWLKDLTRRERIFQAGAAGRPDTFPPLRTPGQQPNNLSPQLHLLVGRDGEEAAAVRFLRGRAGRALLLTGPAGTGKTRLAVQVAAALLGDFADGVYFVALGPVPDPSLVAAAIASTLGLKEGAGQGPVESLQAYLRPRSLLLVLDNFEQVAGAAPLVDALLADAPQLKVLVTSREILPLGGAHEIPVRPFVVPDLRHLPPLADLARNDAIALFTARAQEAQPAFALTAETAPVVAAICARLDGLPLAIELAAARSKQLSPAAMLARLEGQGETPSLSFLASGAPHLPARQQTLRAAIGWSYALLDPEEQALFARLAVFAGGCTVAAAVAVGGDESVVSRQSSVVSDESVGSRQSVVGSDEGLGVGGWGLGTEDDAVGRDAGAGDRTQPKIQNPKSKIEAGTEDDAVGRDDENGGPGPDSPGPPAPIQNPKSKIQNPAVQNPKSKIEARLESLAGKSLLRRQIGADEVPRYVMLGTIREYGLEQLDFRDETAVLQERHTAYYLALAEAAEPELRGPQQARWGARLDAEHENLRAVLRRALAQGRAEVALRLSGALWRFWDRRGHLSEGRRWLEAALALGPDVPGAVRTRALNGAGNLAWGQGDYAAAERYHTANLALRRTLGNLQDVAGSLNNLGIVAMEQGQYQQARPLLEEGLALARALGDQQTQSTVLNNLGRIARYLDDYVQAAAFQQESLALRRALGDQSGVAYSLYNLGQIEHFQGRYARAVDLYLESLALMREAG
ncbi:MAG TPA: tetratricopeptide repeat protein, partial [Chloroflexia bacterium]|nr:tetratricopeptide repeat protein [Chloroflexia bacterium]